MGEASGNGRQAFHYSLRTEARKGGAGRTERRRTMKTGLVTLAVVLAIAGTAFADIPHMISYQGRVTDASGVPVADGTYTMQFRLFDDEFAGSQKWESGDVSVTTSGGVFSVLLGGSPQPAILLHFDEDLWLAVRFEGVDQLPRQRMASVGYAYMASGLVPGTEVESSLPGPLFTADNTSTGGGADGLKGETSGNNGRGVHGVAVSTWGSTRGVYGQSASSSGYGVAGSASATSGSTRGVSGEVSSTAGTGVYGMAWASTGVCYGGLFETESSSGTGVRGIANATSGVTYGVYGRSYSNTTDSRGVYGRSYATTGATYGVHGWNGTAGQGYGVYGYAPSSTGEARGGGFYSENGHGVLGWTMANSGLAYGVYGYTHSDEGRGVAGFNSSSTGSEAYGVYGRAMSSASIAGYFENIAASSGTGVCGLGVLQGGIFHDTSSGNWAACGRASYKVLGTGSVDFVQNHPQEADRVIVYAAPEGDEVATYTRGTARLKNGEARIPLGETFKWVTNPDIGLTAHLTPRTVAVPLAVASITTEELVVRGPQSGPDDVTFDYLVYGLRIGFEEHSVVQEKDLQAYIPSMEDHRALYATHPELRRYNALERFKTMHAATGADETLDFASSRALHDAIQEYDQAVHGAVKHNDDPDEALVAPPANRDEPGEETRKSGVHPAEASE
jgi:hypothetical protein